MDETVEAGVVDAAGVSLVVGASWTGVADVEALVEAEVVDLDNGEEVLDRITIVNMRITSVFRQANAASSLAREERPLRASIRCVTKV